MASSTLVVKPTENVASLGREIAAEFVARLDGLKLDAVEQALVDRAAHRLAAAAVLGPGAPADVQARLKIDRDAAVAALANILAAKSVRAESLIRDTAYSVIDRVIKVALGLLLAA